MNKLDIGDLIGLNYIDGITIVDNHGRIVYSVRHNPRFDSDSQVADMNNVLNRNFLETYKLKNIEESSLYKSLKYKVPIYNKCQTFKDFKDRIYNTQNITIPIIRSGKVVGAIELSKDITTNKHIDNNYGQSKESYFINNPASSNQYMAQYHFEDIITSNEIMLENISKAKLIADSTSPILVYGATGTGKELFIQSIHNYSSRKDKPFVVQNCASIPETLMETTLFGCVKGAFTGSSNTAGLFELADGGTLFLDEFNSMPLNMQAKLLRVLQDGYIKRVGDTRYKKVDVRIIVAMNIDPMEALNTKLIRDDVFYRLNVISFKLIPLINRREDIVPLANYFISKYNLRFNKSVTGIDDKVEDLLLKYDWPGNVRELQHIIESAMNIVSCNKIMLDHLPIYITEKYKLLESEDILSVDNIKPLNEVVKDLEIKMIKLALNKTNYNVSKAAKLLKLTRQTLQYKIEKYNIELS